MEQNMSIIDAQSELWEKTKKKHVSARKILSLSVVVQPLVERKGETSKIGYILFSLNYQSGKEREQEAKTPCDIAWLDEIPIQMRCDEMR